MTYEKFILPNPELEAEIYYLTENEGGRKSYVKSGYRGQFFYNGRDWDAAQEFIDKEICNPGETIKVKLQTLSPDFHIGQFYIDQFFETREGAKTVGQGKITKILIIGILIRFLKIFQQDANHMTTKLLVVLLQILNMDYIISKKLKN